MELTSHSIPVLLLRKIGSNSEKIMLIVTLTLCSIFNSIAQDAEMSVLTLELYDRLLNVKGEGFFFGMHDATGYGVGWNNDRDRSDIESVTGDYSAFAGWGTDYGITQIARGEGFEDARYKMKLFHDMGGFNTLEWHAQNPYGGNYLWEDHPDQTENVVKAILPSGEKHQNFLTQLDNLAAFFHTLLATNDLDGGMYLIRLRSSNGNYVVKKMIKR